MPREVGAALLASAEGYTPRATQLLEAARERLGTIQEIAGALADDLPGAEDRPVAHAPPAQAQEEGRRGRGDGAAENGAAETAERRRDARESRSAAAGASPPPQARTAPAEPAAEPAPTRARRSEPPRRA